MVQDAVLVHWIDKVFILFEEHHVSTNLGDHLTLAQPRRSFQALGVKKGEHFSAVS